MLLGQMPLELRVVFVLHEIEQLTDTEIAEVAGIPRVLVASRLREVLDDFATHLQAGSELADALLSAARQEQPPAALLRQTLQGVGVGALHADGPELGAAAVSSAGVASQRSRAGGAPPGVALAAKWLALGLLLGLALASTAYALADASSDAPHGAAR